MDERIRMSFGQDRVQIGENTKIIIYEGAEWCIQELYKVNSMNLLL